MGRHLYWKRILNDYTVLQQLYLTHVIPNFLKHESENRNKLPSYRNTIGQFPDYVAFKLHYFPYTF